MTKRFIINNDMDFNDKIETYELNCIVDNENKTFYFIADSIENVQLFVKRLNESNEENEYLKQQNKRLEEKIQRERTSFTKTHERWSKEAETKIKELVEENEQLKQLLDYADDLIQSHLSEHYIRQWRNFKTGHKEYNDFWEEKLKKHKELKEGME